MLILLLWRMWEMCEDATTLSFRTLKLFSLKDFTWSGAQSDYAGPNMRERSRGLRRT